MPPAGQLEVDPQMTQIFADDFPFYLIYVHLRYLRIAFVKLQRSVWMSLVGRVCGE